MPKPSGNRTWTRHLIYRAERSRTTWKLRLGLLALVVAAVWLTGGWWTVAIARSLVCQPSRTPSDAILVENFDPDYRVFERASELRRAGVAARVLVPTPTDAATSRPNAVALGTVEMLTKLARVGPIEIVPMTAVEPISLNAARDVLRFLQRERIRSVTVVTPLFRSRRSALVYGATLGRAGIVVRCEPVSGSQGVTSWTVSWHGIQDVVQQWLKLQYYRLYVLPFRVRADVRPGLSQTALALPTDRSCGNCSRGCAHGRLLCRFAATGCLHRHLPVRSSANVSMIADTMTDLFAC